MMWANCGMSVSRFGSGKTDGNGNLGAAKLRSKWGNFYWNILRYMTVCNCNSAWCDARSGSDSENRKFVLLAARIALRSVRRFFSVGLGGSEDEG